MTVFIDTHIRREIKKYIFREMYTFFSFFFFFLFFFFYKNYQYFIRKNCFIFLFFFFSFFFPSKIRKRKLKFKYHLNLLIKSRIIINLLLFSSIFPKFITRNLFNYPTIIRRKLIPFFNFSSNVL